MKMFDEIAGLPRELSKLLASVNEGAADCSDREDDARMLAGLLAKGDYSMAEHSAKKMIERQRNIHSRSSENDA